MSTDQKKKNQKRIDLLLVDKEIVTNRSRAQSMILAGLVLVDEVPVTKAGTLVSVESIIRLKQPELSYVSRGAIKLKEALSTFGIQVKDQIAIDVGASTGGFTEVLLEQGTKKVFAIDVGTNQMAWKIRSDPRVEAIENYNARHLKRADLIRGDFNGRFDLAVMDVSFISVIMILPALRDVLKPNANVIVLFKPQFEVGKQFVGVGGIVKDQTHALKALDQLIDNAKKMGYQFISKIDSPIKGKDGNQEYLIHWSWNDTMDHQ
jgi:23S rRNA (cytidine1920-2'-O)/16S rRNA (cytidine1409-2'-O)-methyltransferase